MDLYGPHLAVLYHDNLFNISIYFLLGIFAYLNYLTPKKRAEIIDILLTGLKRLEYRGYDSAGKYILTTSYSTEL